LGLLLDLAAEVDFAHDFKEVFQSRGYGCLASPTVVGELHEQSVNGPTPTKRGLARIALSKLWSWDVVPLQLSAVETGIAEGWRKAFFL
jgi:hypothetical protein